MKRGGILLWTAFSCVSLSDKMIWAFVSPMHANSLDPGRSCFSASSATCVLRNSSASEVIPGLSLQGGGNEGTQKNVHRD